MTYAGALSSPFSPLLIMSRALTAASSSRSLHRLTAVVCKDLMILVISFATVSDTFVFNWSIPLEKHINLLANALRKQQRKEIH